MSLRRAAIALVSVALTCNVAAAPTMPYGVDADTLAATIAWKDVAKMPVGKRPKIVLVLGGGGARGLAHVGVLRALSEEGIPVDEIVGVSVGALVGALYSSGISIDDIEVMANEIGWSNLTDYSRTAMVKLILADELLSSNPMQDYLKKRIGDKTFNDLKIPFSCIATDIRTGERVIFHEGSVATAARASATIPAIFKPVEYRHRLLVDGGLTDNLPTDVAKDTENPQDVIVIGVLPVGESVVADASNVFRSLVRAIDIQKDIIIESKKKGADFMIEPNVGAISIVDLGKGRECIEAGTLAARRSALELKALILTRMRDELDKKAKR